MNRIAHATKTVDSVTIPPHSFPKQTVQMLIIRIQEKQPMPTIAPQHNMINPTGIMKSWLPCHDGQSATTPLILQSWKPDPFMTFLTFDFM
jgi:hypothetical protein